MADRLTVIPDSRAAFLAACLEASESESVCQAREATTMATPRSDRRPAVTMVPRHALGRLEDGIAASGWMWNAELSHRVDHLLVLIEAGRP